MMKISVVCGSRAKDNELLLKFFSMLNLQTFTDFDVNIVCDRNFTKSEESDFVSFFQSQDLEIIKRTHFFTNNNSDFNPDHKGGASYVRNFGIKKAKGEFIQLFDDDNEVGPDFLENCLKKREEKISQTKSECVILPSLYYRDLNQIQNQGFSHFDYLQARPIPYLLKGKFENQIQMFSGNGIFAKASTLKKVQYDEEIARISEDLDYTLSLYEQGIQLRVFSDLKVIHHERDKSRLEQARIGSYSQAKQKVRNRLIFIKKHGNKLQRLQSYFFGFPCFLIWLIIKVLLWGGKIRIKIIKGIIDGVRDGRLVAKKY